MDEKEENKKKAVFHWPIEVKRQHLARGLAVSKHRYSVDFFGVSIDARKSDVQKAIRRGLTEQALVSFFAAYNMTEMFPEAKTRSKPPTLSDMEASAAKATQTNIVNRLMVIALEDVGMANPHLVCGVVPILLEMSKKPKLRNPRKLAWILTKLSESQKSRMCSHAARAYLLKNREEALKMNLKLQQDAEVTLESMQCFEWLDGDSPIAKSPDEIFELISKTLPTQSIFKVLCKAYASLTSDFARPAVIRFILMLAHMLVVQNERGQFVRAQMLLPTLTIGEIDVEALLTHNVELYERHPVMSDSVDYHTAEGRKKGSSKETFRTVGAVVENESALMVDADLKNMYEDVHKIL